jgi:hypothetical protein
MTERKGVLTLIYDDAGTFYFFIAHNKNESSWGFPKVLLRDEDNPEELINSVVEQVTGIKHFKVIGKYPALYTMTDNDSKYNFDIFLIEANMNTPVKLQESSSYDTYLWGNHERTAEKITRADEKRLFLEVLEKLKANNSNQ